MPWAETAKRATPWRQIACGERGSEDQACPGRRRSFFLAHVVVWRALMDAPVLALEGLGPQSAYELRYQPLPSVVRCIASVKHQAHAGAQRPSASDRQLPYFLALFAIDESLMCRAFDALEHQFGEVAEQKTVGRQI
jgi:hypothetical protein